MRPTLFVADLVLTDADSEPLVDGAVLVTGARIAAVGPAKELVLRYGAAEVLHLPRRVLAPGFVNAHHHLYGVLAHGIPMAQAPAGFWPFLAEYWWPRVEDALTPSMIAAATDLNCCEMLRNGVTSFYDCLEAPHALPDILGRVGESVGRWGLRAVLSFESTERAGPLRAAMALRENARFIDACRAQGGLVSGMMCFHTTFTCSPNYIHDVFALAGERGARVHAHVSEGTYEPEQCLARYGLRPIAYYEKLGVLGPSFLASQCVQVNAEEIDLLAMRGVAVAHMPLSNCEVGGGFAPTVEMRKRGITVGLGSDGYINNPFEVMRGAFLLPKARLQDPAAMPASEVWRMATEAGAMALGLEGVGRLQEGWQADLIAIRIDDLPTPATPANLRDQLILWRNPEHVTDVWAAGRPRKRHGAVLGADEAGIREACRKAAAQLWGKA